VILALLELGAEPGVRDYHRMVLLPYAAGSGSLESTEALLDSGAFPDSEDIERRRPLSYAASEGSVLIVERLLSDPRVPSEALEALSMAAGQGHEAVVQLLLKKGANPNNYSSLSHTVRNRHDRIV